MNPRMASGVSVSKLSFCRRARVEVRAQRDARQIERVCQSQPEPGRGRPKTAKPVPGPYMRLKAETGM